MAKPERATEYHLLRLFVIEMEKKGVPRSGVHLDVDAAAVDLMRGRLKVDTTLEEIQRLADT